MKKLLLLPCIAACLGACAITAKDKAKYEAEALQYAFAESGLEYNEDGVIYMEPDLLEKLRTCTGGEEAGVKEIIEKYKDREAFMQKANESKKEVKAFYKQRRLDTKKSLNNATDGYVLSNREKAKVQNLSVSLMKQYDILEEVAIAQINACIQDYPDDMKAINDYTEQVNQVKRLHDNYMKENFYDKCKDCNE